MKESSAGEKGPRGEGSQKGRHRTRNKKGKNHQHDRPYSSVSELSDASQDSTSPEQFITLNKSRKVPEWLGSTPQNPGSFSTENAKLKEKTLKPGKSKSSLDYGSRLHLSFDSEMSTKSCIGWWIAMFAMTLLALITRMYNIQEPQHVW